ncbi:MAG: hypothetical protein Q4G05_02175 [Clostridia bacterium]|nr:hypothetical protein [Clostridia bacterium]
MGTFLGENDSWKELKKPLLFFKLEEIKEMFKGFEIVKIDNIEKDDRTGLGVMKHWHIYNVVAKKI